ncbi:hypothetical protein [Nocardia fusca]|uniref:hypothetical protein n=1 Tax=Nocardia fusca TaxID=941183 RepID=UPI000B082B6F|nr:hypothetical protein [Nocardia fusca]
MAELGTTPLAWLTAERVTLACRLLERGEQNLHRVARPADWELRPISGHVCAAESD